MWLQLQYAHALLFQTRIRIICRELIPLTQPIAHNIQVRLNARRLKVRGIVTGAGGTGADQPTVPLAAAAKRIVRERIQDRWKKQWESERTA